MRMQQLAMEHLLGDCSGKAPPVIEFLPWPDASLEDGFAAHWRGLIIRDHANPWIIK